MRRLLLLVPLVVANLGQAPAVKGGTVTGTAIATTKTKRAKPEALYVYLESTTANKVKSGKGIVKSIEQKEQEFSPAVTVIPQGATIFFPNRDNEDHSVFSPSVKLSNWIGFDLGSYGTSKQGRSRLFPDPGEFDIYCDIHKDMWAKVKVLPSPHFTPVVNDKFTFVDIPPGTYRVVAWAPHSPEKRTTKSISVTADGTIEIAEVLNVIYEPSNHVHDALGGRKYVYP